MLVPPLRGGASKGVREKEAFGLYTSAPPQEEPEPAVHP
jgi:hypothetical protein